MAKTYEPAFPVTPTDKSGQIAPTQCGMSLRDWFAGQALAGMQANPNMFASADVYAMRAYKSADAMLAERNRL